MKIRIKKFDIFLLPKNNKIGIIGKYWETLISQIDLSWIKAILAKSPIPNKPWPKSPSIKWEFFRYC